MMLTQADKEIETAREKIVEAIYHLNEVVINKVEGSDDLMVRPKQTIRRIYTALIEIRDHFDEPY